MYMYEPLKGPPIASKSLDAIKLVLEHAHPGSSIKISHTIEDDPTPVSIRVADKLGVSKLYKIGSLGRVPAAIVRGLNITTIELLG